jgi:hypothetical protein
MAYLALNTAVSSKDSTEQKSKNRRHPAIKTSFSEDNVKRKNYLNSPSNSVMSNVSSLSNSTGRYGPPPVRENNNKPYLQQHNYQFHSDDTTSGNSFAGTALSMIPQSPHVYLNVYQHQQMLHMQHFYQQQHQQQQQHLNLYPNFIGYGISPQSSQQLPHNQYPIFGENNLNLPPPLNPSVQANPIPIPPSPCVDDNNIAKR